MGSFSFFFFFNSDFKLIVNLSWWVTCLDFFITNRIGYMGFLLIITLPCLLFVLFGLELSLLFEVVHGGLFFEAYYFRLASKNG